MKPVIETVFMVESGYCITALPVLRRTPKGVVYLKDGVVEVHVRPSSSVVFFATASAAREYVRTSTEEEIANHERHIARLRARKGHVDNRHVEAWGAEQKDPGQARRRIEEIAKNILL